MYRFDNENSVALSQLRHTLGAPRLWDTTGEFKPLDSTVVWHFRKIEISFLVIAASLT